jgi:phenylalanyl-tRNA synthetase beta chain
VTQRDEDTLVCQPPPWRANDLTREVDLIEEIARLRGLQAVQAQDRIVVSPRAMPREERMKREARRVLAGMGFFETVTFSFASREGAAPFVESGLRMLAVDDARRAHEPVLRPSALAGLLTCRRANQDGQVSRPGGVRLFERSSTFAETTEGASRERVTLALLADVPGEGRKRGHDDLQRGVRMLRGAIEALVNAVLGPGASVRAVPGQPPCSAWNPEAFAWVEAMPSGTRIGRFGLIARALQDAHGLDVPLVAAEIDEAALVAIPEVRTGIRPLPAFPAIERDLSPIVAEETRWEAIDALVGRGNLEHFEALSFVGSYRGEQAGAGRKSMTLRARFRAPDRTLRHEDVDPQMNALMGALTKELGATFRLA